MIALVLVLAASVPPQAIEAAPRSVYRVKPSVDGSIIGASALAIILPYAFASDLIHPHCPCDPATVNALDRHVIGNHNKFLDDASDVTTGIVMLAPRSSKRRPQPLLFDAGSGRAYLIQPN